MPKKRPKQDEEELPLEAPTIGSYISFTDVPKTDKPLQKDQIGFVRQKKKERKKNVRTN